MPFSTKNGTHIYYEVEGDGPPLVLIHAFLASQEYWRMLGYVEELKSSYKLIMPDLRGHGRSDKPYDAADYGRDQMARDVVGVLDDEGLDLVNLWGYSLGGTLCFLIAQQIPQRIRSFIVGGASGKSSALPPQAAKALEEGTGRYVEMFASDSLTAPFSPLLAEADARALHACALGPSGPLDDTHPLMTMPGLVYLGDSDPNLTDATEVAQRLPDAQLITLPEANHLQAWMRRDLAMPHVKDFLLKVTG